MKKWKLVIFKQSVTFILIELYVNIFAKVNQTLVLHCDTPKYLINHERIISNILLVFLSIAETTFRQNKNSFWPDKLYDNCKHFYKNHGLRNTKEIFGLLRLPKYRQRHDVPCPGEGVPQSWLGGEGGTEVLLYQRGVPQSCPCCWEVGGGQGPGKGAWD